MPRTDENLPVASISHFVAWRASEGCSTHNPVGQPRALMWADLAGRQHTITCPHEHHRTAVHEDPDGLPFTEVAYGADIMLR